jgi:hypothetical protein
MVTELLAAGVKALSESRPSNIEMVAKRWTDHESTTVDLSQGHVHCPKTITDDGLEFRAVRLRVCL